MCSIHWELILLKAMGRPSHMPLQKGKFYSLRSNLAVARGYVSGEDGYVQHFTVLKGATGPVECVPSFVELYYYRQYRNDLLDQRILINKGDYLKLTRNHEFIEGPSLAATILLGCKVAVSQAWKEDTETRPKGNSIKRHTQQVADADDAPLRQFEKETRTWPQKTEADQLVRRRRGQDILREHLMKRWRCCPLTGIPDPDLLRASQYQAMGRLQERR